MLRNRAVRARSGAYAPYSKYPVGAAAITIDGRVVAGCNVENVSYGLTLCAECTLIGDLYNSGGGRLRAVTCVDSDGAVILPCAAGLLMLGPRYLPAPEVTMITLLEVILGPLLVWAVIGEDPGQMTLIGGTVIVVTIALHTLRRLTQIESPA